MATTLQPPPEKRRDQGANREQGSAGDEIQLSPQALKRLEEREKLRTSKFDVVSSFLMALMWFIGIFALLLFLIWLTSRLSFGPKPFPPIIEEPAGRGENAEGFERDFEPPGADEIVDLEEPTIEETLTAVTDAVSSVAATLDSVTSDSAATTEGTGKGDSRPPGPEGEGEDIVPRHERWQLEFAAKNVSGYAQQLDFYEIELGALGGGVQGVDYAANLAGSPSTRRGESDDEQRLYFMWVDRSNELFQYDRQLLQKGGVNISGREIIKFVEPELENQLAHIELEYAKEKGYESVTQIQKTIFESRAAGNGYEFVVIEQRYRTPKGGST